MSTSPHAPDDVAATLAAHVADLRHVHLPEETRNATRLAILDTIARTIAGAGRQGIAETLGVQRSWSGVPESTVALWGDRLPAHEAVIANVAMAHAQDASLHATAAALWSALATAETLGGVSGDDLLLAVAGGVDLTIRLRLAAQRSLELGYDAALFAGFGAAAATATLRRLDGPTIHNAFGIAFSQAGATVQAEADDAFARHLQPAFNAADGLRAALFAERGITGVRRVFEGPYGFYRLFNHSGCERDILLDKLGALFHAEDIGLDAQGVSERLTRAAAASPVDYSPQQLRELEQAVLELDRLPDARILFDLINVRTAVRKAAPRTAPVHLKPAASTVGDDAIVHLVEHVRNVKYEDIPAAARDSSKRFFLDAIATTIAGAGAPGCDGIIELLNQAGGKPESSVAVFGGRLPAHNAVIANIMMCHALELDDLYDPSTVHATTPALWSSLAVGEALGGVSGRDFLTAGIVGADVMCRIGNAAANTFGLGHHNALLAGFAAVAAAGSLKRSSPGVLQHAFGLAFSQAAAAVQALPDGALVKRLQPAMNASDGLRSLAFAEAGITGVTNVLEGKFGFARLFSHACCDREALLDGLGHRFLGAESSIKRFPSSRCTHGPIEAMLAIKNAHGLRAQDIAAIELQVSPTCVRVAGGPFAPSPAGFQVDAQFNIPYTVSAALLWGDVFIDQFTPEYVFNQEVRDLAAKMSVTALPNAPGTISFVPVIVKVTTTSGAQHVLKLESLRGAPQDPLSWDDIVEERVMRCVRHAPRPFDDQTITRLIEALKHIDDVPDIREIIRLLVPAGS